ncbi:hypothetical protein ACJX0J_010051, partial [Zea mays]
SEDVHFLESTFKLDQDVKTRQITNRLRLDFCFHIIQRIYIEDLLEHVRIGREGQEEKRLTAEVGDIEGLNNYTIYAQTIEDGYQHSRLGIWK